MEQLAHSEGEIDQGELQPARPGVLAAPAEAAWEAGPDDGASSNGNVVMSAESAEGTTSSDSESPASAADADQPAEERKSPSRRTALEGIQANVYHDPARQTVTLLLDERYASAVIFAVRALAADYEAHAREVRAVAATLPSDSYGALNRHFIAIRHERIAARLRMVESNYRMEVSEGGRPAE
jgi:hypothetical protein